jgi:hypothetical protein
LPLSRISLRLGDATRILLQGESVSPNIAAHAGISTINIDNGPAGRNSSIDSFSVAIDGDYTAFGDSSLFFAGGVFDGDGTITLSFEFTSGYAPEPGILHAIRALIGHR